MKYVALDFDGTITTRDTIRFLIRELIRLRPLQAPGVFSLLTRMVMSYSPDSIQELKNRCVGKLIKGLSEDQLVPALERFCNSVRPLFRLDLISYINKSLADGKKIIVASASPAFALRYLFSGQDLIIIATEFEVMGKIYTGNLSGDSCYGDAKAEAVLGYLRNEGEKDVIIESAWSDAISDLPFMNLAEKRYWYCSAGLIDKIKGMDPKAECIPT
ncbi:MAG: hypothetical protein E3K32_09030 [wastewater metagenome]|nr:hypothetical protein [Candidatus Loosdrechtia aerotolerans]